MPRDIMVAFASIDPHKGKRGVREARRLIGEGVVKGFKFHPTVQGFFPNDRMACGLYGWIKDFREAGFKPEVHDLILKENAIAALDLAI